MPTRTRFGKIFCPMLVVGAMSLFVQAASASDPGASDEPRRSTTRQIEEGGRDGAPSAARKDEYGGLRTAGDRGKTSAGPAGKTGDTSAMPKAAGNDFWFFTADVELFNDDDGDGFYHGIDLLFDADTYFEAADVYVVAFLSYEGGPWNEYASTDVFTIFGATSDDEYVIVTELTSGYPTGDYDLLIELYDAVDGAFLASFGPADTSELSFLPLEDFQRDEPFVEEIVVVEHGGGSSGPVSLTVMLLLSGWAMRRRFRPAARTGALSA